MVAGAANVDGGSGGESTPPPRASQSSSRIVIEYCELFSGTPPVGGREWPDRKQQGRLVRPCFNEYDDECRYRSSIILRV
jgi:hypothetical protein